MQDEVIRQHFEAIKGDRKQVNRRSLQKITEALVGRPLEAAMSVADRMAVVLAQRGHVDENSAIVSRNGTCVWSVADTNQYRRCLVLDTREGCYALMLHLANEPKPWDAVINESLGISNIPRDAQPGRATRIVVAGISVHAAVSSRSSLGEVMKADLSNGQVYMPSMCFSRSKSTGGYSKNEGFLDGLNDLREDGMNAWTTFFRRLEEVANIVEPRLAGGTAENMNARKWEVLDRTGLSHLSACEDFALALHEEYGLFLPGQVADAVRVFHGMCMEADARLLHERLDELRPMLVSGDYKGKAKAYDDGRSLTWIDKKDAVVFEDQNSKSQVFWSDHAMIINDLKHASGTVKFHFDIEDGAASIETKPNIGVNALQNWNAINSNAATVLSCLEEDQPDDENEDQEVLEDDSPSGPRS